MAPFTPESRRLAALALTLLLAGTAGAQLGGSGAPISLDADSSEFDRRNNVMVFRGISIRQRDLTISASSAQASQLDFSDAEWTFSGRVVITNADARLEAQTAVLRFVNNDLRSARIEGGPAAFEQRRANVDDPIQGRASLMEYDLPAQVVKMSGSAWLREGNNEILGEMITYNISEQRVLATSDEAGTRRVQITITPETQQEIELPELPPDK